MFPNHRQGLVYRQHPNTQENHCTSAHRHGLASVSMVPTCERGAGVHWPAASVAAVLRDVGNFRVAGNGRVAQYEQAGLLRRETSRH